MRNLIIAFLLLLGNVAAAANIGEITSYGQAHKIYKENRGKFQIVEYHYAPWCVYCPRQAAIMEELARENRHTIFLKINGDVFKRPEVRSYPTVIIAGQVFSGLTPKEVLQSKIRPWKEQERLNQKLNRAGSPAPN